MTITTAILVNLFLLSSGIVCLTMAMFKSRYAAAICFLSVLSGYSFNIFHVAHDPSVYMSVRNGTRVHTADCLTIRHADPAELNRVASLEDAKKAGLIPHFCITGESVYVTARHK